MISELETRVLEAHEQVSLRAAFSEYLGSQTIPEGFHQDNLGFDPPQHTGISITAEHAESGYLNVSIHQGNRVQLFELPSPDQIVQGATGWAVDKINNGKHDTTGKHDFIQVHHLGVLALCYKALGGESLELVDQTAPVASS